jgi:pre-mRNA-splicing factor ISY1
MQLMEEWESKAAERDAALAAVAGGMADADAAAGSSAGELQYVAYVPLPDEKEIEARVVARKKAELLAKYSTPALQAAQEQAVQLLSGQ